MLSGGRKVSLFLFLGDIAVFFIALWLTLFLRYGRLPSEELLKDHFGPFAFLFAVWTLIFFMSGLYEKKAALFKNKLANVLFGTQLLNIVLAALFFFSIPELGITPKTNLAIYLVVSLGLIFLWRLIIYPRVTHREAREGAALIASGKEADELVREVNAHPRYRIKFSLVKTPKELAEMGVESLAKELDAHHITTLVVDAECDNIRSIMPKIYELCFVDRKYQYADFEQLYEEVFDRVPLSLLKHEWFLKNVTNATSGLYVLLHRMVDVLGGVLMGVVALLSLPFVYVAMRLEGPGPIFIVQDRLGQYGSRIKTYKFRSMTLDDRKSATWVGEDTNRVTRVGALLRKTSLDEFPQFINVLRGELSLIGPRNDIEGLGLRLAESIPYYNVRCVVKPGITGWAQINQQYEQGNISPQSIEETKVRLAYDFYYIKNRSFMLDVAIALKTVKRMLFRVSSW